jgi:hypothetical protein
MNKLILILALVLTSCQTLKDKRANNKMNWLMRNHYLGDTTRWVHDTIPGFKVDTIFKSDSITLVDTFTIIKDGVEVKTVVKWKEKTLNLTLLKRDTIVNYEIKEKVYYKPTKRHFMDNFRSGFIVSICFLLLILILIKKLS